MVVSNEVVIPVSQRKHSYSFYAHVAWLPAHIVAHNLSHSCKSTMMCVCVSVGKVDEREIEKERER